jgi:hypothetical protein
LLSGLSHDSLRVSGVVGVGINTCGCDGGVELDWALGNGGCTFRWCRYSFGVAVRVFSAEASTHDRLVNEVDGGLVHPGVQVLREY